MTAPRITDLSVRVTSARLSAQVENVDSLRNCESEYLARTGLTALVARPNSKVPKRRNVMKFRYAATRAACITAVALVTTLSFAAWTPTGSMRTARASHTATLLANGLVLVAGGTGGSNAALA